MININWLQWISQIATKFKLFVMNLHGINFRFMLCCIYPYFDFIGFRFITDCCICDGVDLSEIFENLPYYFVSITV